MPQQDPLEKLRQRRTGPLGVGDATLEEVRRREAARGPIGSALARGAAGLRRFAIDPFAEAASGALELGGEVLEDPGQVGEDIMAGLGVESPVAILPALGRDITNAFIGAQTGLARRGGERVGTALAPPTPTPGARLGPRTQQAIESGQVRPPPPIPGVREGVSQRERVQEGVEGALDIAASGIPFGPAARIPAETAAEGDVAGAVGETLGLASFEAVPRALSRLPATKPRGRAVPGLEGSEEVFLKPSQRRQSPGLSKVETFLERTTFGQGPFVQAARQTQQQLVQLADDVIERATTTRRVRPGGEVAEGIELRQALRTAAQQAKQEASNFLEGVLGDLGDIPVETAPLKEFARRALKEQQELAQQGGLDAAATQANIRTLQATLEMPEAVPLRVIQQRRSALLDQATPIGQAQPGTPKSGLASKLAQDTRTTMLDAAAKRAGPQAAEALEQALNQWRELRDTFTNRIEQRIINTDAPETIAPVFLDLGTDSIKRIKSALPPDKIQRLQRGMMQEILEESMTGELRQTDIQALMGRGQNVQIVDGGKGLQILENQIGRGKLNTALGKENAEQLIKFFELARDARARPGAEFGGSPTPGLIAGGFDATAIISVITGTLSGSPEMVAGGAAFMVGTNLLSRVLANTSTRRPLFGALRNIGEGNLPQAAFFATRLQEQMQEEGITLDSVAQQQGVSGVLPETPQPVQLPQQ